MSKLRIWPPKLVGKSEASNLQRQWEGAQQLHGSHICRPGLQLLLQREPARRHGAGVQRAYSSTVGANREAASAMGMQGNSLLEPILWATRGILGNSAR